MEDEKLKKNIGINIAAYRKASGWTQAELAQKLNYSDKAVSKWERGDSVPDVLTMAAMAKDMGITVNDLLADPNELPDGIGAMQQAMGRLAEKTLKRKANKNVILALSSLLVWFVALFAYVVASTVGIHNSWLAFFYAVPINAIVMLSLRSAWHDFRWNQMLISVIVWGWLVSFFMTGLILFQANIWKIFLLGVLGQIAIFLWFRLFHTEKTGEEPNGQAESET